MDPRTPGRAQAAYGWVRARPLLVDAVVALAFAGVAVLFADLAGEGGTWLGMLMVVPLAWRRVRPVASAAAVAAGALVQVVLVDVPQVVDLAVPLALFSVVAYGPRRAAAWFTGLAVVGSVLAGVRWTGSARDPATVDVVGLATVVGVCLVATVAAVAAGEVRRLGRLHEADAVERARLAEAERAQEARLAAAVERARIAREMHDVVAHSLAVMIAQADGARYVAAADPGAADGALRTVSDTGRRALADMRGLLGVLRDGGTTGALPQPGLDDMESLVDTVRAAGTRVTLTTVGTPPADLPRTWQLAAYRIVQESLTNVLKHAGAGSRARVTLGWRAEGLCVDVSDEGGEGALVSAAPEGLGIVGMRQRAATQQGSLRAGPRQGGGWQVTADLPYPAGGGRAAA